MLIHRGGILTDTLIIQNLCVKCKSILAYCLEIGYNSGMEAILEMPRRPRDIQPRPLREIRESKYWTVATVARLSGVDPATIWRIENGRTVPHRSTMKAIADALGVHPSEVSEFEVKRLEDQ